MIHRNTFPAFFTLCCLALFVSGCATTKEPRPPFEGLGALSGGKLSSFASAVSADGRVVVGQSSTAGDGVEAYRWEDGRMEALGVLKPGDFSSANAISADGSTIVGSSFTVSRGSPSEAFIWKDGKMQKLSGFPCGDIGCSALGVSSDGSVVVGRSSWRHGEKGRAFVWTQEDGMQNLQEVLENRYGVNLDDWVLGSAEHISDDGTVIAGSGLWDNTADDAFRWVKGSGMSVTLPGIGSADTISRDGTALVGSRSTRLERSSELVLWKDRETAILVDKLNHSEYFVARGASACGATVVGFGNFGDGEEAFIWTEADGMRRLKPVLETEYHLDLAGWKLRRAEDISHDGAVIVGSGINPEGEHEAWRAVLRDREAPSAAAPVTAHMECGQNSLPENG